MEDIKNTIDSFILHQIDLVIHTEDATLKSISEKIIEFLFKTRKEYFNTGETNGKRL